MQGYVAVQDGAFAESGKCFRELEGWLASEDAAGLQHADLEELTASVTDGIPAVIAAAFDEPERRDPGHSREWAVLIDGNNTQIEAVTAEAAGRGITITIVIDLIYPRP